MTARVVVLYNTDYDEELTAASGVDVSAVEASARAVSEAVAAYGYDASLLGVHGRDLCDVVTRLEEEAPDLVFNLCESLCGDVRNEQVMPAILEMLGLRFTGTDGFHLRLALHKDRAKEILHARGVATPPYTVLATAADLDAPLALDYPYFLKLAHEDASIGIEAGNVADDRAALVARARAMLETYRQPVLAERFVEGREVNVTVLGNGEALRTLPLHEIDFSAMPPERPRIISYAAKWDEDHIDYGGSMPVPMKDLDEALAARIETTAFEAYRALGLRDYGRVDLRVDGDGRPWVIDVNPNCDISPDAGVARAASFGGIDYPALVGGICETAWARYGYEPPSRRSR